jgi:hypothetical protein
MPETNAADIDAIRYIIQASDYATPDADYAIDYYKATGKYARVEDGTVYPLRTFKREIFVPASEMWASAVEGSALLAQTALASNGVDYKSLDFDAGATNEKAQFSIAMPDDWNAGTIIAKFYWTAASGSGTVIWGLQARASADDDALDAAWGTAQTVTDTLLAASDMHVSPESNAITVGNTPAAGEWVQFRVYRESNTDTLAVDAKLLGIKIYYY